MRFGEICYLNRKREQSCKRLHYIIFVVCFIVIRVRIVRRPWRGNLWHAATCVRVFNAVSISTNRRTLVESCQSREHVNPLRCPRRRFKCTLSRQEKTSLSSELTSSRCPSPTRARVHGGAAAPPRRVDPFQSGWPAGHCRRGTFSGSILNPNLLPIALPPQNHLTSVASIQTH